MIANKSLFWCLMLALLLWCRPGWAEAVGFVALVKGEVSIERDGAILDASMGMEVKEGDHLRTGEKARLKVLFTDDALIALGSDSEVIIKSHMFDAQAKNRTTRLELLGGKLRALVQRMVAGSRANFEVETSNAVAGVRGTEFILLAGDSGTRLYTFSGSVEMQGEGGEKVMVAAGRASSIEVDGRPREAKAVAAAELERVRALTDSQQSPEALAMNLAVPTERLEVTASGVTPVTVSEADQDSASATAVDLDSAEAPGDLQDLRDEPPVGNYPGVGGKSLETAFSGEGEPADGASPDLLGEWRSPDMEAGIDVSPIKLHIKLYR